MNLNECMVLILNLMLKIGWNINKDIYTDRNNLYKKNKLYQIKYEKFLCKLFYLVHKNIIALVKFSSLKSSTDNN